MRATNISFSQFLPLFLLMLQLTFQSFVTAQYGVRFIRCYSCTFTIVVAICFQSNDLIDMFPNHIRCDLDFKCYWNRLFYYCVCYPFIATYTKVIYHVTNLEIHISIASSANYLSQLSLYYVITNILTSQISFLFPVYTLYMRAIYLS